MCFEIKFRKQLIPSTPRGNFTRPLFGRKIVNEAKGNERHDRFVQSKVSAHCSAFAHR